ncbi:hypothetical protein I79_004994 [Cricetulus griseus]|uniref:Uncharacterized protein n=1 Tax=Cricetulus griseus TaxID=10029 RepID=G3H401_CRIGR|nr:hypothetical protein I79_004994 [Cricetulus griseus]
MATCDAINKTPQLQPRSILPLATQKIAEIGLGPYPPRYLEVRYQRGTLIEPGLGEGKARILLG